MLKRTDLAVFLKKALQRSRVVALVGPRQCGKTTMSRSLVDISGINYFDLEDPASIARLSEPLAGLRDLKGLVAIDEVQRRPELFPVLRVLADRRPLPARFLILGSASPDLLRQSSESLAGRIEIIEMSGFGLQEIPAKFNMMQHWQRGGFPLSFLAATETDSFIWRKNFILTFLERDLPQWGIGVPAVLLHRFWTMLAHYHGQIWNAAEPARSLGISEPTVRRYLDILSSFFMIRQLQPWHANIKKRQVKSPKIYFRDTGLLHQLLGIRTAKELLYHPKFGVSWEGYAIEEAIKAIKPDESFFWATHNGAEIDLVIIKNGKMYGIECKYTDAPQVTPSMRTALDELKLIKIAVIYPGTKSYELHKQILAVPLTSIKKGISGIFSIKS
ncbi:MAG: hypothetical protein A2096_05150 [Spirochaetes bacterium GWF1_41_5]|nr:MAG: hypothetical protein A2096_05150 [Spirochaetes bacterium GWF1_41_5]HBE04305.1 hypothetical protein [Spirochaetia bacterium]